MFFDPAALSQARGKAARGAYVPALFAGMYVPLPIGRQRIDQPSPPWGERVARDGVFARRAGRVRGSSKNTPDQFKLSAAQAD